MKKRFGLIGFITLAITALYLTIPACGSKSNNNNPAVVSPYGTTPGYNGTCLPGQNCVAGIGGGLPLVNGPVIAKLDDRGSIAQLTFGGTNVVAGQTYYGPVNIVGTISIAPGGVCPPGTYQVNGQGQWQGGYGGTVGRATANLQIIGGPYGGFSGSMNTVIYAGQDPFNSQPTMYYMWGNFGTSCDPTGVAN